MYKGVLADSSVELPDDAPARSVSVIVARIVSAIHFLGAE